MIRRLARPLLFTLLLVACGGTAGGGGTASSLDVPADAGHVFVLLADIRKLACDALALPMGGSRTGKVSNSTLQSRWLCYPRAVTELPPHSARDVYGAGEWTRALDAPPRTPTV